MNKKKTLNLPLSFEQTGFRDERFTKVRVKVMHNGQNFNGSTFYDEAIEKAAPSLKNVPLLAFIKKIDGTDQSDFGGHEVEFKITEDGVKVVYLGRPIGLIPETNNYAYEEDVDGIKYVYVDAYIWNNYSAEALEIIERDEGKSVSMEIELGNYEVSEGGALNILDYQYQGVVALGEDVPPAMRNARLDISEFSRSDMGAFVAKFSKDLKETLDEENKTEPSIEAGEGFEAAGEGEGEGATNPVTSEPDTVVTESGEPDESQKVVVTGDTPEQEKGTEPEEGSVPAEPETPDEKETKTEKVVDEPVVDEPVVDEPVKDEPVEPAKDEPVEPYNPSTVTITKNGATIRKFEEDIAELEAENKALKEENESLKAFKAEVEKKEFNSKVNALVENFSDLPKEDIESIVKTETNYEIIELKLYALRGRLNTETPAKKIQAFAIYDSGIQQDKPSWETLVEQYKNKKTNEGGN